ncbi:hypothetical protein G9A89_016424 [Geosiphon pyriformis]|nr:hypothetical protein G9A89_016424 [Geosiphon pyriformis]
MPSDVLHPEVLWAQRTDELYVTINLNDIKDPVLDVTKDKISFQAVGGIQENLYGFELELYKEIKPEASKRSLTGRNIILVLDKAEHGQSYWPRLQKVKGKIPFLKTDFSKWKDEDEEEENDTTADALGGMDFSSLMGGADAGAGMDSDDTDEDVPSLETPGDAIEVDATEPTNVEEKPNATEQEEQIQEMKE